MNTLIENIDKLHTTEMGKERRKRSTVMRYIKQIVGRNKKLVFAYLIIGLFNAFIVNFKAGYFQKVIDALAEHTLAPYRVMIYGSVLFISYLMNYVDEYPAKKLEHGIFLDFKLMGLEKISRISSGIPKTWNREIGAAD